jgi:gluconolactonase
MYRIPLFIISLLVFISCNSTERTSSAETDNDELLGQLKVEIYDPSALALIDSTATFEILADGFSWSEGPLWVDEIQSLLFSDVPNNIIHRWNETDGLSTYLESAGHSGEENRKSGGGPNGLILDRQNRLLVCQHGDRRVARLEGDLNSPQGQFTTLAGTYQGKKFNSPNDLVMDRGGNIYFTDPPYGLPQSKTGEIGINGVFRVSPDNEVTLLVDTLTWPNGIALSADEKTLYINQSDRDNPVLYSYTISPNGSLVNGRILFDFKPVAENRSGLPDGLKIHRSGNIFATGPGGVHIISPQGQQLALISTVKATANCAFDTTQEYLYLTTSNLLMRVKMK